MPKDPARITEHVKEEARGIAEIRGCDPAEVINRPGLCRIHFPTEGVKGKTCSKCKIEWSLGSFNKNRAARDGLQSRCRQCDYESERSHRLRLGARMEKSALRLEKKLAKDVAKGIQGTRGLITRNKWPLNKTKRLASLAKDLPQALSDYDGQEAQIAVALKIPIAEIREVIAADPELQQALEFAQTVAVSKVEANAYKLASDSNNATMVKYWLNNKTDEWSDKSQVDVRSTGFGAPSDKEELAPIVQIVKETEEGS